MEYNILRARCLLLFMIVFATGCTGYLDVKPDKKLVVPKSLEDLKALMSYNAVMNNFSGSVGEASADNYFITSEEWASLRTEGDKNIYLWENDIIFEGYPNPNYWSDLYRSVYYSNVVLENIDKMERTTLNGKSWDDIKGRALFYRARAFHNIAVDWAKAYDEVTASTDLGIPLRLNADFNERSVRSSIEVTYSAIISDLKSAIPLLPIAPEHVMNPSKPAAYALLSRVYLSMRKYNLAGLYADSSLQLNNSLMDFNNLNPSASYPVKQFNTETLFYATGYNALLSYVRAKIDTNLMGSYKSDDLRKVIYFGENSDGTSFFKGNYSGSSTLFVGITTDEMYLTKAECLARSDHADDAMKILNSLLVKRWKEGAFEPFTASDSKKALSTILIERRKELLMRDLRWMDLKRLNKEKGMGIVIHRMLNGEIYELPPNDPRYALPIPTYVINISGMPQNARQ